MAKKRPERTAKRAAVRSARQLVRDREKLAALVPGGSAERPIAVDSTAVVEVRVRSLVCPQCEGTYRVNDHTAPAAGLRQVAVTCTRCHVSRDLWFKLGSSEPS